MLKRNHFSGMGFNFKKQIKLYEYGSKVDYDNMHNIYFRDDVTFKSTQQLTRIVNNINMENKHIKKESLKKHPIKIHITSTGGDPEAGLFCYDQLKLSKIPIYMYGEGYVISAATIIFMAGYRRFMTEHTNFLMHQISYGGFGTQQYMKNQHTNINRLMENCKNIYLRESKIKEPVLNDLLCQDIYLNGVECKKYGIIDKILKNNKS
jgi:ATP-dependent Clp protease, protease subunit